MKAWLLRLSLMALFLVSFGVLLPGVAPHITAGDAGELALAGSTLGVAHSPGYPVFALAQRALGALLPFGNAAFQQNIAGTLFVSLALTLVGLLLMGLTGQRWAVVLPALLLTAPLLRRAGHTAEVFPLAFFWAALILVAVFFLSKRPQGLVFVAFLFGLGVAIHQTLLLMAPAALFYFLRQQGDARRTLRRLWLPALAAFAGGLTIFLYLPIRSSADPVLDWEDPETLRRFWDVVTRARYGFLRLAQNSAGAGLSVSALATSFGHLRGFFTDNLGWTGGVLLLVGSLHSLARRYHRRFMATCWLHIFFTGPFFFWVAGVPLGKDAGVLARFGLLPLLGGMALMALGLAPLWASRLRLYRGFMIAILGAFCIEAGVRRDASAEAVSLRWDGSIREAGLNMLRSLPAEAVLFADRADESEFSLAYLLGGENRRPGVTFVDCNAGVSRSIYGDDYYRVWGRPRLLKRTTVEGSIVSASKLPVFYATVDPAMVDVYRTQAGLLFRAWPLSVVPPATAVPWHRVLVWPSTPLEPRSRNLSAANFDLLGRYLFETKQFDGALTMFGLAQRQGGPNRWEQMAYWFQVRGDTAHAREAYEKADASGDESANFFSNRGALFNQLKEVVPAIETYEKGLIIHPDSVNLLYNLAVARWETGSMDEARRLAQRVLQIDPSHVDAQHLLTQVPDGKRI